MNPELLEDAITLCLKQSAPNMPLFWVLSLCPPYSELSPSVLPAPVGGFSWNAGSYLWSLWFGDRH